MPFDGLVLRDRVRQNEPTFLETMLTSLGIVPVPNEVLQAHKRAEVAAHPASLFYRQPNLLPLALIVSFFGFIATACIIPACLLINIHSLTVSMFLLFGVLGVTMVMVSNVLFLHNIVGPAQWEEKHYLTVPANELVQMPPQLRSLVSRVQAIAPTLRFTIGTLYQEKISLDPYVLVEHYDYTNGAIHSACLGIWKDDVIIQMARSV